MAYKTRNVLEKKEFRLFLFFFANSASVQFILKKKIIRTSFLTSVFLLENLTI